MNEVYLNGRPAVDWEIPVIARARQCERDRGLQLLAGILTETEAQRAARGTDLAQVHAQVRGRRRTIDTLDLDVLK